MVFVKSDESTADDSTVTETTRPNTSAGTCCIAHLSDLHLFNPANMLARDFLSKRILGYMSWRLHRQAEHQIDFMPALLEALRRTDVDHIVITGDLTHLSHAADFETAAAVLDQLGGPDRLTLIPGNHDAYVPIPRRERFAHLDAYMPPCAGEAAATGTFEQKSVLPSLRKLAETAVIGISTARPTAPFLATGSIGRNQLDRLEKLLVQAKSENLFRLIMIHHPPVQGLVSRRKCLTDQAALAVTIRNFGAELLLHGHTHRFSEAAIKGPAGLIPVIGVPSLTALTSRGKRRAGFHLNRIRQTENGWTVEITAYRYSISAAAFQPIGTRTLAIPPVNS